MKNRWATLATAIFANAVMLLGAAYAIAQESSHQHMQMSGQHQPMQMGQQLKTGKTGEITFSQATKIGDVTLPPDTYRFAHRASGDEHFMKFTGTKGKANELREIKCQIELLPQKASQTAVTIADEAGTRRINRIEIAGENVAHIF